MSQYSERIRSLREGYLPPSELDVPASLALHRAGDEDVDAVTYEVLRSRLWSINLDHQEIIRRMSGSGVTVYADDFNTAIATETGEGVVFGPSMQFFAGCADAVIAWTIEHRAETVGIRPGDVFIQDDPWVGTNHAMDTAAYAPVFVDGRLFCWVYNVVHQQDLGGVEPGGFVQQASDTFWEPTVFPPTKLIDQGVWRDDVVDAWIRRSRIPEMCQLEVKSQVAGLRFAAAAIERINSEYGPETLKGVMRRMITTTEKAVKNRIRSIPDGTWRDERYIAGALPEDRGLYKLVLSVRKAGDTLTFSNEGTDPSTGAFNTTAPVWRAAILNAAMPLLAYDQYLCGAGVLRCMEFEPSYGSITTARWPAAVGTSLGTILAVTQAQHLINKLISSVPEMARNIIGASAVHTQAYTQVFGTHANGEAYANFPFDCGGGGTGAFAFRDGIHHGGGIISTRLKLGNVEEWEQAIPFLYLYRREVLGGGGHGKWRGGTSLVSAWTGHKLREGFISSGGLLQSVTQGHGISGGYPGSGGAFWSALDTSIRDAFDSGVLPGTPEELRAIAPHGGLAPSKKFNNRLGESDLFEMKPSFGAGHGDPLERDLELIWEDVRDGQLSSTHAREIYGAVVDAESVDHDASSELRLATRRRRLEIAARRPAETSARVEETNDQGVTETVALAVLDGTEVLACVGCGQVLCGRRDNYRDGCAWVHTALNELDPDLFTSTVNQVDVEMVLRQYVCPSCARLIDTDICPADDPAYQDVALVESSEREMSEAMAAVGAEPVRSPRASSAT
jgi:N-methylhydantoinase B